MSLIIIIIFKVILKIWGMFKLKKKKKKSGWNPLYFVTKTASTSFEVPYHFAGESKDQ